MTVAHRVEGFFATRWMALALASATPLLAARDAHAQDVGQTIAASLPGVGLQPRKAVPFDTGERLTFDVRFGGIKVGTGRMEVVGTQDVRGREAWHTRFTVKGGIPFYKVNDRLESWIDTRTFTSLRLTQQTNQGRYHRERRIEFFPDRATMLEAGDRAQEEPTVAEPLDEGALLYFIRTLPLNVGDRYSLDRYFKPDRNPVQLEVVRRERVRVPAGTFETIVIRPTIKSPGIFSESGRAEVWVTDDDRRLMVQMTARLSFGTLSLSLRSISNAAETPLAAKE
jgi:hypothetical protein